MQWKSYYYEKKRKTEDLMEKQNETDSEYQNQIIYFYGIFLILAWCYVKKNILLKIM